MNNIKKVTITVSLSSSLLERAKEFVDSPVSRVKSRRDLIEKAILKYLEKEEIIVAKLEKELAVIQKQLG